jgi:GNAT superfamily N-acetyltransferase
VSADGVSIRIVTADDWEVLRGVRLAAMLDSPTAFGSTYERELSFDSSAWRARIERSPWWLAWREGQPVGMIAAFDSAPDTEPDDRHVVSMWVHPAHRGHGVADLLVETLADWAVADGARTLSLWVVIGNDRARRFYERCGFVATGEIAPVRSNPSLSESLMRRPL